MNFELSRKGATARPRTHTEFDGQELVGSEDGAATSPDLSRNDDLELCGGLCCVHRFLD